MLRLKRYLNCTGADFVWQVQSEEDKNNALLEYLKNNLFSLDEESIY